MCFLPLCHIAERIIGEYSSVYTGCVLNFVENPDTIPENVREISPTFLFAVPRVWEKFYSGVVITIKEASRLQQLVYAWAIGIGSQVADKVLAGQPVDGWLKFRFEVGRVLALNNVRKLIGIHRAQALLSGAAPISPELIRWYLALGIPMLEGWGMTESGALGTASTADKIRPGTIGRATDGVEVRVDPQTGELLIHLRQRLLQTLVEPCVLSFNGRERFVHHGFGVLQCNLDLGLSLVQHFVQCSTGFVQRGIDLLLIGDAQSHATEEGRGVEGAELLLPLCHAVTQGLLVLLLELFFDAIDLGDGGLELANRALVL
jgi:acyl-CoA synthetase (AMP-forming)/AMP-acid ligase II